eukprot:COSAG02_NODE_7923_length_2784_cov_6.985847_3_plen_422_part_00
MCYRHPACALNIDITNAPLQVPDWNGVPDEPASGKSDVLGAVAKQVPQKRSKKSANTAKPARSTSVAIDVIDPRSAIADTRPDGNKQKKKKKKEKATKRKERLQLPTTTKISQRQQSANSGIFSIDDASPGERPPSMKKRRKSADTDQKPDDSVRAVEAKAAARAEKQQQREQQRRETAAIAATRELRPEEEQQLEKGAALLLRKLKGVAEVKQLASVDSSNGKNPVQDAKGGASTNKSLHTQYKKKLSGARFRYLNEMLYTSKGADSFLQFQEDPELFDVYHSGFREQVEAWPVNPVDIILKRLARLQQRHSRHGAAGTSDRFAVADFGCGDAAIAQSTSLCSTIVHSFDLVARNDWVTSADMAHVPLPEGAANVAVFSLSLMGVNYIDYIIEAHRIVAPGGRLLIAEVSVWCRSGSCSL